jgi:hypothetical protein
MFRIIGGAIVAALLTSAACAQETTRLSASDRADILDEIATTIDENYFDEARAREIAEGLRGTDFGAIETHEAFAEALTAQLHAEDRHFSVRYVGPDEVGAIVDINGVEVDGEGNPFAESRRRNFGFQEVSILPGNIGYIDLREFAPIQGAGETATAALNFIANTDAVIFDVRQNGGGDPSMVQFLISHFLDPRQSVAINTFVSRRTQYPVQLNSLTHLPSAARPNVPVFVLTSGNTGSAAEAFAYHLQAMERATIVGETTYGAGNPGDTFALDTGYLLFISTGSARNPITGTNWEGVGVAPDVETQSDAALDAALLAAYADLVASDAGEQIKLTWRWAHEGLLARITPTPIDESAMAELVGSYGPRRILLEDGVLKYQRDDRPIIVLTPLGEDRFLYGDDSRFRVVFDRNQRGDVTALAIESLERPRSVSPRD